MVSLTKLAVPIYQSLSKKYKNLTERKEATKLFILNEITQWTIKESKSSTLVAYKPREFSGTSTSKPFEVRLVLDPDDNYWELKFGNMNAPTTKEQFNWDDKDPFKLQKAVFLHRVLETKVIPFIKDTDSVGIKFIPYNDDSKGEDRLSYFMNMFNRLNKNDFELTRGVYDEDDAYYISPKI